MTLAAAAILLAAAGCSASGSASSGSGANGSSASGHSSSHRTAAAADAKTYTADDLKSILTAAKQTAGLDGAVQSTAQISQQLKSLTGSSDPASALAGLNITYSPAACQQLITKNMTILPPSGTTSDAVVDGSTVLTVSTVAGKQLPAAVKTGNAAAFDEVLSKCGSMTISMTSGGQTLKAPMTIKKISVPTEADRTLAIEASVTIDAGAGASVSTKDDEVVAVKGNLLIAAVSTTSSASTSSGPSLADMVNAVVAAAK